MKRSLASLFQVATLLAFAGAASAQTKCGSLEQVAEQVAGYVIPAPFGRLGAWGSVAGGAAGLALTESPGDMVKRCMEEAMGEINGEEAVSPVDDPSNYPGGPPREEPEEDGGFLAWLLGDPHLKTLDSRHYDFQGAGDYILLRHEASDAEVHVRLVRVPFSPAATFSQSLAVRVGERVVSLYGDGPNDPNPVVVDGIPVPFLDGGTFEDEDLYIQRFRQWFLVRFRNGLAVATVGGRTVNVRIPKNWSGKVTGLLGNSDGDPANDIARRDGTVVDPADTDALYAGFLDDWLVAPADSLFRTPFDESESGPIRPEEIITLESLPADAVAEATEVCAGIGLAAGPVRDGCVFDVALTGDESWASADLATAAAIGSSRPVTNSATGTEIVNAGILQLDEPVSIAASATQQRRRWSLESGMGAQLFLRSLGLNVMDGMSASTCTASWSLLDKDDNKLASGSLCNDEPRLQANGAVALAIEMPGGVGGRFVVGNVAEGASVTADLRDRLRYDGELLSPAQVDRYEFNVEPGTRILLMDPGGKNNCGVSWAVSNNEEELFRGASCFDTDPIAIPAGGKTIVAIDARADPGPYSLEVVRVPDPRRSLLRLGEPLDASIATPGGTVEFTFDGEAGEQFVLANTSGATQDCGIVWRIIHAVEPPTREFEGPVCFDTSPVTLGSSGPYVLEVDGKTSKTGSVSVTAYSVPEPKIDQLQIGEALEVTIASPGVRVQFEFAGNAGEQLMLTDPTNNNKNCNILWRILGPDADPLFEGPVCFDSPQVSLPGDGNYLLEVRGKKAHTGRVVVKVERE